MLDDDYVDGNALGGLFFELFGAEMTDRLGCCGNCGSVAALGTVHVFRRGPGDVLRCATCSSVLLVVVPMEPGYRITFEALRWLQTV